MAVFQHGVDRLIARYPFHGALLAQTRVFRGSLTSTMGVRWRDDRVELHWNPEFVASLTAEETCGVLCHEQIG